MLRSMVHSLIRRIGHALGSTEGYACSCQAAAYAPLGSSRIIDELVNDTRKEFCVEHVKNFEKGMPLEDIQFFDLQGDPVVTGEEG